MSLGTGAEILCVGDELVRGLTRDANGAWVAARLAAVGVTVARITILPDEVDVVAGELRAARDRARELVITSGGLGPTTDDRTLEAVSRSTDRALALHPEALELLAGRYRDLAASGALRTGVVTDARRKMAQLPEGASALPNPVGTAPGCALTSGDTLIVSLPGVPDELHGMWEEAVTPILRERFGQGGYAETTVLARSNDESAIAALLAAVSARHEGVYVKSRAQSFERGGSLRITLVAGGVDEAGARRAVDEALTDLGRTLEDAGFGLDSTTER